MQRIETNPNIQKVQAPPILCRSIGKLATTKKLKAKFETVQMLIEIPRILSGKTSDTIIQPTGPRLIAKKIIYVTKLPTATHFWYEPKTSANAKDVPRANKLSITPVKPRYNKGFLPNLSVKYIATIVIKKLIIPMPAVA